MLQLCNVSRCPLENLLMAGTDQQHICQNSYAKGFFNPSLLPTHLICSQSQVSLKFPMDLLHRPPALVWTDYLSREPFVQIGHQDFCLFWGQLPLSFTQKHRDVTDVPQTRVCARHPEGFIALGPRDAGHPQALRICARHIVCSVNLRGTHDRKRL
jgi:hypothetical protein